PRAHTLGLGPGAFSFNVPGGRCDTCEGDGFQKLEMYFVEDVYVTCQECEGKRYRPDVLQVTYKNRDISQVLQLTVDEAVDFFASEPVLQRRLKILREVGLGYLRLGQPPTTLSGGGAPGAPGAPPPPCRAARPSGSRSRPSSPRGSPPTTSSSWTSRPPACTSTTSASCSWS